MLVYIVVYDVLSKKEERTVPLPGMTMLSMKQMRYHGSSILTIELLQVDFKVAESAAT